jgi:hypothetical protein
MGKSRKARSRRRAVVVKIRTVAGRGFEKLPRLGRRRSELTAAESVNVKAVERLANLTKSRAHAARVAGLVFVAVSATG